MAAGYRFEETVTMPRYMWAAIMGGMVGLLAGLMAPLPGGRTGRKAWLTTRGPRLAGVVVLALATLTFRRLKTVVDDDRVKFGFGVLGQSLPLGSIQACEVKKYNPLLFGGWGIRLSWGGRRAYSMLGAPRGVEITVARDKKARRYFVSSTQPELLASALSR
ncbi:MAG: hypothetical protein QME71_02265 [Dehalococcoidia bacterium]|nr:hypothetical protein [Dehalococcoidia bacterium]